MEMVEEHVAAGTLGTILVKGNSGTGKSTMALGLLRMKGRGTLISSRVTRGRVAVQEGEIVFEEVDPSRSVGRGDKAKRLTPAERAQRLLRLVAEAARERPKGIIVIDSWETVATGLGDPERSESEQNLVAMAESSDSTMVIVSERDSTGSIDSLVDGIIELRRELHEEATLRTLEFKKLASLAIPRPVVLFTLSDGRFRLFDRPLVLGPGQYDPRPYKPIRHPVGRYSSGISDLDAMSGDGVQRGTSVTLELGEGVSVDSTLPLHQTIIANFIANGGCTVGILTSGVPPEALLDPLERILPKESVASSVRLGFYKAYSDPCAFAININSVDLTFQRLWEQITKMKGSGQRPCYTFLSAEKLEHVHGAEVLRDIVVSLSRSKSNKDLFALIVDQTTSSRKAISAMTDLHFRIESIAGAMTMQPIKPRGPLHAVQYDYSLGYPQVSLTPIV
jgi:KaiC/GvpD/RAD55 family RecA-like ATPase